MFSLHDFLGGAVTTILANDTKCMLANLVRKQFKYRVINKESDSLQTFCNKVSSPKLHYIWATQCSKLIVIFNKLPWTFDSFLPLYDIHACIYKKIIIINLDEEKKSCSWEGNWTCDTSNFSKARQIRPKCYNHCAI